MNFSVIFLAFPRCVTSLLSHFLFSLGVAAAYSLLCIYFFFSICFAQSSLSIIRTFLIHYSISTIIVNNIGYWMAEVLGCMHVRYRQSQSSMPDDIALAIDFVRFFRWCDWMYWCCTYGGLVTNTLYRTLVAR